MSDVPNRLIDELASMTDLTGEVFVSRAPGRVEVLGNHTDYNGGLVLAASIERFVWAIGTPAEHVTVRSLQFGETVTFDHIGQARTRRVDWHDYIRGVFWAFERRKKALIGLTAVVDGSVPIGSGLSSSAALEVAVANLVARVNRLNLHPKALAMMAFEAERLFCGVSCGIMDQFTSQLCAKDSLLAIECSTMQTADVPLNPDLSLLVVESGVSRTAGDVLNARRRECDEAVKVLREYGWEVTRLSQIRREDLDRVDSLLPASLSRRVRHVVTENDRVRAGIRALHEGRVRKFGQLMYESHASSRDLYEVSHPRLDLLVDIARRQKGVVGARLTGAGLGGSVLCLVRRADAETVSRNVAQEYESEAGVPPATLLTGVPGEVTVRSVGPFTSM
ncbi:MAG: galactokinase [Candidatus Thorarchaeota archaeon]